ncbi:MAG TPA: hypothetical protein VES20_20340 [Bryobacteraceae bacterium]|nr:hypothetical protein [Bryobacteraceae bacterium]
MKILSPEIAGEAWHCSSDPSGFFPITTNSAAGCTSVVSHVSDTK